MKTSELKKQLRKAGIKVYSLRKAPKVGYYLTYAYQHNETTISEEFKEWYYDIGDIEKRFGLN